MPNVIDGTGLQTATQAELVTQFQTAMQRIYGADIDLSSSSPDGQMMMIFIQSVLDTLDLLTQIYNTFDPDNAMGVILDQRVAINGIQRQAGTFTVTPVSITVTQAVTLYGLDQTDQPIFTVADNAGNEWQLQNTQYPATPGVYSYSFQAANPGAVLTVPNTITVPVTIVLGVSAINNPLTYTTLGIDEESDATLKVRRQKSVTLSSQGYYAGLLANLLNISGVTAAFVYENTTDATNSDGVPSHSIWVIVAGSGDPTAIGQAIYNKRNAGCGMKGSQVVTITQADGSPFQVKYDNVVAEPLYIEFDAHGMDGVTTPDADVIKAGIVSKLAPGVYESVNINELATIVQEIDSNCLVTNAGFATSGGGPFSNTLTPSSKNKQFSLSAENISITLV